MLYALRKAGLNIQWVTFDSYQSADSIQILRRKGFVCGTVSVDTDLTPYLLLKSALYDERLTMPPNERLTVELRSLERDPKKNKIDHPALGSKDLADSLAGVVHCLYTRRDIWNEFGFEPVLIGS